MGELRRSAGFLAAVADSSVKGLLWPEGCLALIVGVGGGAGLLATTAVTDRVVVAGDLLPLVAALLGVVFAAFALLITLLSDDYLRLLDKATDGVLAFMRPFVMAIGFQIVAIVSAVAYRAAAEHLPSKVEVGLFLWTLTVGSYALLDVLALARTVTMHGITRARQLSGEDRRKDKVRQFPS